MISHISIAFTATITAFIVIINLLNPLFLM